MALFDSVISGASEKFGLGDKAGTMLSAVLALITNEETGGFSGFINKFRDADLGDTATSWITSGDNAEISGEQLESALGEDTVSSIAQNVGMSNENTASALAYLTPKVIDNLTPEGEVPNEKGLLKTIGGYLTGADIAGDTAGIAAGSNIVADNTAESTVDKGTEVVGNTAETVGDAAEAVGEKISGALDSVTGGLVDDGNDDGGSILKWLLPLVILGILIAIGFYACRNNVKPVANNADANHTETNTENMN